MIENTLKMQNKSFKVKKASSLLYYLLLNQKPQDIIAKRALREKTKYVAWISKV